ncbi:unnamed protein product [Dovyalis caffra]|uniref:Uncharacterized protein n=1 Tax=Dovyalis caffra TaxID=77055 RepID=A0AAV1SY12_9ROSI|nr:unnamed protein product [Dovyalis caffra]
MMKPETRYRWSMQGRAWKDNKNTSSKNQTTRKTPKGHRASSAKSIKKHLLAAKNQNERKKQSMTKRETRNVHMGHGRAWKDIKNTSSKNKTTRVSIPCSWSKDKHSSTKRALAWN